VSLRFPKPASTARTAKDKRKAREAHWQKIRRAVLARDGRRCRVCGSAEGVEVHHIRFRSTGGAHTTENCACLCRICHSEIHGYRLSISGNADQRLSVQWSRSS
jgi:5-methylcytosine-specific restriction endonuclease McrA